MLAVDTIKRARRASAPLIVVRTSDPAPVLRKISESVANGNPMVCWDIARGCFPGNDAAQGVIASAGGSQPGFLNDPLAVLTGMATRLPGKSILVMLGAHRWIDNGPTAQAVWNLRDLFKLDLRTLILLAPSLTLPPEIEGDAVVIDDERPNASEIGAIAADLWGAAYSGAAIPGDVSTRCATSCAGLTAFGAEQAIAMSLKWPNQEIDADELERRKVQQIEETPGLQVWRGRESFSDIGGYESIKGFLCGLMTGPLDPGVVVFVDEIEKVIAGAAGDLSGVRQDQEAVLLREMQDMEAAGLLLVGPPGVSKSLTAKAVGTQFRRLTVAFDLGSAMGSLVGQSEGMIRRAFSVIRAACAGRRPLFIATCNSIGSLKPELRRRFRFGIWYYDLPTAEERAAIWPIQQERFGLDDALLPDDHDWTGADIAACCETAWAMRLSLRAAACYVVPVARSAPERIEELRQQAAGRFLSASQPGAYTRASIEGPARGRRSQIGE